MSSRPLMQPYPVIGTLNNQNSGVSGNMAAPITSLATILTNTSIVSYAYIWTGTTPVGTIAVQVSNDYSLNAAGQVSNTGTWNTLPLSTTPVTSGSTGNGAIDIDTTGFYAIRTTYTPISGTGTLTCVIKTKVD